MKPSARQERGKPGPLPGSSLRRLAPPITLSMLAVAFLAVTAHTERDQEGADPNMND
jgi:hypothetical protein